MTKTIIINGTCNLELRKKYILIAAALKLGVATLLRVPKYYFRVAKILPALSYYHRLIVVPSNLGSQKIHNILKGSWCKKSLRTHDLWLIQKKIKIISHQLWGGYYNILCSNIFETKQKVKNLVKTKIKGTKITRPKYILMLTVVHTIVANKINI